MTFGRPELIGTCGAVASTHSLATAAGMAVLADGGNAFDAITAAGFVLLTVEPHSNGLGGDATIVVHRADRGQTTVVCGQGPTPAAATLDRFRTLGLNQIPGSGLLPACVPGAFGAWLQLLADHGTRPLRTVMDRAIGYAERGCPLVPDAARAIAALAPLFRTEWAESGRTYLTGTGADGVPTAGAIVRNPRLAATMRRLLDEAEAAGSDRIAQIEAAHDAFYRGFVAETIDRFVGRTDVIDSTGRRHRGLLTGDDLAGWRAAVEEPVLGDYHDYTVCKPGPWSQGPVFAQQLAVLAGVDLAAFGSATSGPYVHHLTEAAKLAFADREGWYGDPQHTDVPMKELLSAEYTAARRAQLRDHAEPDPRPGNPGGRTSWLPTAEPDVPGPIAGDWFRQLQSGMPTIVLAATVEPGDTCSVVAVDRHGNMAAAVPSGGWLKSSPVLPGLGFPLGTRAQSMWLVEDHPNAVRPRKRPRSTLSPSIVLRGGEPYLAFGTPGGDRQDVWTMEAFLATVTFGAGLQEATETPTFHSDHFPSSFTPRTCRPGVLVVEAGIGDEAIADLRSRGHQVDVVPQHSMGNKICIVGRGAGHVRAGAGPRGRQADAAVY